MHIYFSYIQLHYSLSLTSNKNSHYLPIFIPYDHQAAFSLAQKKYKWFHQLYHNYYISIWGFEYNFKNPKRRPSGCRYPRIPTGSRCHFYDIYPLYNDTLGSCVNRNKIYSHSLISEGHSILESNVLIPFEENIITYYM